MHNKTIIISASVLLFVIMITSIQHAFAITWSTHMKRLTTYTYFDGFPSATQTRDGRIWIVWSRYILGNQTLFYATSSDLGTTWSDEANITGYDLGHNEKPSIVQLMNGTIMVVWQSNRPPPSIPPKPDFSLDASPENLTIPRGESYNSTIIVTSLHNFSEPVDLFVVDKPANVAATLDPITVTPPPNETANSTLAVSVNSAATPGNYTVTVLGKSGKIRHMVGIGLEVTEIGATVLECASSSPCLFFETEETSATECDYELFYKVSNDNGETWSKDIQITNNTDSDTTASVVQLMNGTIMVVWQSDRSGDLDIYCKTTLDGTSWSTETPIVTHLELDKSPSIIQAKDQRIWVAWHSDRSGDNEIFYKTYDGFEWSDDVRLIYSTNCDICPSILQTIDETVWIFWASSEPKPNATDDIYYVCSSNNGVTWSDRTQFTTNAYEDTLPSTIQTRDTKIWVVWTSNRAGQPNGGNWDIYYRTSLAGDINEDGIVDIGDLSIVGMAYGTFEGELDYNPDADINKDGIVDMGDITIVSIYYGET